MCYCVNRNLHMLKKKAKYEIFSLPVVNEGTGEVFQRCRMHHLFCAQ
jgi:hypothetical protein